MMAALAAGFTALVMVLAAMIALDRDPKGFIIVVFLAFVLYGVTYITLKLKERKK